MRRPVKIVQLVNKHSFYTYYFSPDGKRALTAGDDGIMRLWDLDSSRLTCEFEGHTDEINCIAWSTATGRALTGGYDCSIKVWDVETGKCLNTLKGHEGAVWNLEWEERSQTILSCSSDGSVRLWSAESWRLIRQIGNNNNSSIYSATLNSTGTQLLAGIGNGLLQLWDVSSGKSLAAFGGHNELILCVAFSPNGHKALSGSEDETVRLWDIRSGRCLRVLEGHRDPIYSVAWNRDSRLALSGSIDATIRLWDTVSGSCLDTLTGHGGSIQKVAWLPNYDYEHTLVSADNQGEIRFWNVSELTRNVEGRDSLKSKRQPNEVQYTNAKIVLVGESGSGKTGLIERLSQDTFTPSHSTSGTWSTQWQMHDLPEWPNLEREIWLWDFGGQADQRLVHQLYLDKTALVLLVFNSDRDVILPGLREWQQALLRSISPNTKTFLVAGRIDVGLRFDRQKVVRFAIENGYEFFETSAQSGAGCEQLRTAIQNSIQWKLLEQRTSPLVFKLLKDEIINLRDQGNSLLTFKELSQILRRQMPIRVQFTDADLKTVINLLDGPGVVKELNFGTYILLRPEWLNIYAQAVIRTLKSAQTSLGCLPVQSIAQGQLIFQTTQANGEVVEEKRLKQNEEGIVLQAMEQALIERKLCLRQADQLVFPSYYGMEQPIGPMPPKYFISYTFSGFLDDIYATLIVRLAYCGAFKLKELWRDATEFETLAEEKKMGVKLLRKEDGSGELLIYFEKGVASQEQVIFATYIHDHLKERACDVTRLRFYICPICDTPVKNREVAMQRLEEQGVKARIICVDCENYISLWDNLERRFASELVEKKVALLRTQEIKELDSRRKGKLLSLEVMARITRADQKCFEIPGVEDEGLDLEVEFTDDNGHGTGKRLYLQLKSGNSYLQTRKRDGAKIFRIKKQNWVKYWLKQDSPVLLVIGTFPEEIDERRGSKERFADISWMEISDLLRRESENGTKPVRQIVFRGEQLDTPSVHSWRTKALRLSSDPLT